MVWEQARRDGKYQNHLTISYGSPFSFGCWRPGLWKHEYELPRLEIYMSKKPQYCLPVRVQIRCRNMSQELEQPTPSTLMRWCQHVTVKSPCAINKQPSIAIAMCRWHHFYLEHKILGVLLLAVNSSTLWDLVRPHKEPYNHPRIVSEKDYWHQVSSACEPNLNELFQALPKACYTIIGDGNAQLLQQYPVALAQVYKCQKLEPRYFSGCSNDAAIASTPRYCFQKIISSFESSA